MSYFLDLDPTSQHPDPSKVVLPAETKKSQHGPVKEISDLNHSVTLLPGRSAPVSGDPSFPIC